MEFEYVALTQTYINYGDSDDGESEEGSNKKDMNQRLKHIMNKKNKAEFKVGNPLPKNGSCKHYKNSHRYFRFPCCGKGYPCDECHNDNEREHDMQVK